MHPYRVWFRKADGKSMIACTFAYTNMVTKEQKQWWRQRCRGVGAEADEEQGGGVPANASNNAWDVKKQRNHLDLSPPLQFPTTCCFLFVLRSDFDHLPRACRRQFVVSSRLIPSDRILPPFKATSHFLKSACSCCTHSDDNAPTVGEMMELRIVYSKKNALTMLALNYTLSGRRQQTPLSFVSNILKSQG